MEPAVWVAVVWLPGLVPAEALEMGAWVAGLVVAGALALPVAAPVAAWLLGLVPAEALGWTPLRR